MFQMPPKKELGRSADGRAGVRSNHRTGGGIEADLETRGDVRLSEATGVTSTLDGILTVGQRFCSRSPTSLKRVAVTQGFSHGDAESIANTRIRSRRPVSTEA